jgi:hypothetical protein
VSDLYTSYETSLALRDAGAPQDASQRKPRWCPVNRKHGHVEVMMSNYPQCERAFRADEIIDALGDRLASMYHDLVDEPWFAVIDDIPVPIHFQGDSLVEALAQAWLAVLAGAK